MALQDVVNALRQEEQQLATQLSKIRAAIGALGSNIGYVVTGRGGPKRGGGAEQPKAPSVRKRKHRLSAKARAAISAAQKRRWAKVRATKKSM
jgi:hypothetical protein